MNAASRPLTLPELLSHLGAKPTGATSCPLPVPCPTCSGGELTAFQGRSGAVNVRCSRGCHELNGHRGMAAILAGLTAGRTAPPPPLPVKPDPEELRRAISVLAENGQVVELRALGVSTPDYKRPHVVSGYFDDPDKLAVAAASLSGARGVYITLNPVQPDLLARAVNRARPVGNDDATTADSNITRRRWLPIDIDPKRSAGISSSDDELQCALDVAHAIRDTLAGLGWPAPVLATSGNGAHLLYRVDLPLDDGGLTRRVLDALAFRWNDGRVEIDRAVFNPARIWKLYGTVARKGDNHPARPHRLARLLDMPTHREPVAVDLLREYAGTPPDKPRQERAATRFDLEPWIASHGLDVIGPSSWNGGSKWIFRVCPWNADHRNRSAFIVQFPGGAIAAGCHHNGCAGNDWRALRDLVEPGWRERRETAPPGDDRDAGDVRAAVGAARLTGANGRSAMAAFESAPKEALPDPAEQALADALGQVYAGQAYTLADALAPRPRLPSVVGGILPARSLSIWYGSPGSLKSNLLIDLCLSVATGGAWLPDLPGKGSGAGYSVTQCPVLWVDIDNGEDVTAERLAAFARARNAPADAPIYWLTFPTPPLVAAKGLPGLTAYAQHIGAGLIVIDNLLRVAGVRDENASEIDAAMSNLRKLAETTGAAVIVIHHRRKDTLGREGDSLRGHSSIEGAIDYGFLVKREEGQDEVTVKCTKARRKPIDTFGALWTYTLADDGETLAMARLWRAKVRDPKAEAEAALRARILDALAEGPMNQTGIAATIGGTKTNVLAALEVLVQGKQVKCERGKNNARIYSVR